MSPKQNFLLCKKKSQLPVLFSVCVHMHMCVYWFSFLPLDIFLLFLSLVSVHFCIWECLEGEGEEDRNFLFKLFCNFI